MRGWPRAPRPLLRERSDGSLPQLQRQRYSGVLQCLRRSAAQLPLVDVVLQLRQGADRLTADVLPGPQQHAACESPDEMRFWRVYSSDTAAATAAAAAATREVHAAEALEWAPSQYPAHCGGR